MQSAEKELIHILKKNRIEFVCTLPCEKIRVLLELLTTSFSHVPLTREEEGVGISAGIALAGKRPAMFVQSSGIGNMINALLSLTAFYALPLPIFVSQRGIYREKIAAQLPMGQRLPKILRAAGISFSTIRSEGDFEEIERNLAALFSENRIHAFLMSPVIFEGICDTTAMMPPSCPVEGRRKNGNGEGLKPELTRYEILKIASPYLDSRVVVCNLGFPSKELFSLKHQPSNFYMLGSMGMAMPIGLGISLASNKEVVVIDGDGSILMNPGTLATAAHFNPRNLTILAIDNSSYGSTGDQPTLTGSCVDLALLAKGFGIRNVLKAVSKIQFTDALHKKGRGVTFIHALALPGNANVPNIPVHHLDIKRLVSDFIKTENP